MSVPMMAMTTNNSTSVKPENEERGTMNDERRRGLSDH